MCGPISETVSYGFTINKLLDTPPPSPRVIGPYTVPVKSLDTYSFQGFSLFLLFSTLQKNSEDIKTMK